MYLLIIAIHAVFIFTSHLLGYTLFEGIFILLCIFFLFYFSPLFFLDQDSEKESSENHFSFRSVISHFSPKESLFLPIILLYIALYGFVFSIFGGSYEIFSLHSTIVILIYFLFLSYILLFHWKNEIFFEIFRFHTIFTSFSVILFTFSLFYGEKNISFFQPLLGIIGFLSSLFLLSFTKKENAIFLGCFITSLYATITVGIYYFFPGVSILLLLSILLFLSFLLFEVFPRNAYFSSYASFFQYFSLGIFLLGLPGVIFITFETVQALGIITLFLTALFFLSIHTRYTNYIVFILSILDIYFLYSLLFSGLITDPTISSLFLFVFFLPVLLIGTTYFWEENHMYDFMILHYTSILFSIFYSLYVIFFIRWGGDILFIGSLCTFGVALLFFLSYFRFRTDNHILP